MYSSQCQRQYLRTLINISSTIKCTECINVCCQQYLRSLTCLHVLEFPSCYSDLVSSLISPVWRLMVYCAAAVVCVGWWLKNFQNVQKELWKFFLQKVSCALNSILSLIHIQTLSADGIQNDQTRATECHLLLTPGGFIFGEWAYSSKYARAISDHTSGIVFVLEWIGWYNLL